MRILTLDGGPGPAFAVRLLEGLERRHPGFLESVDLFSGTSDGALMSMYLAQALTRKQEPMEAIRGCIKFSAELFRVCQAKPANWLRLLSGSRALFDGHEFYELMRRTFGDMQLADLRKKVLLVGFDASRRCAETFEAFNPDHHPSAYLVDVALATSAFPLLLPGYVARRGRMQGRLVLDGALNNNSVGMAALMRAAKYLTRQNPPQENQTDRKHGFLTSGIALPQVKLLSMGLDPTSEQTWLFDPLKKVLPRKVTKHVMRRWEGLGMQPVDWTPATGYRARMVDRGWIWFAANALPSMVTLLQGTTTSDVENLRRLLGEDHYYRFDPKFDATKLILTTLHSPDKALHTISNWVDRFWANKSELTQNREELLGWLEANWCSEAPVLVKASGT